MTTEAEAVEAVYQRWTDNWTATPLADTTFEGEVKFTPPEGRPWARLSVRDRGDGGQTLGPVNGRRFTRLGTIFVQCFVPLGKQDDGSYQDGVGALKPLKQQARTIFEGVSFSGLRCFQANSPDLGTDSGRWLAALVEVPFDYDETK